MFISFNLFSVLALIGPVENKDGVSLAKNKTLKLEQTKWWSSRLLVLENGLLHPRWLGLAGKPQAAITA